MTRKPFLREPNASKMVSMSNNDHLHNLNKEQNSIKGLQQNQKNMWHLLETIELGLINSKKTFRLSNRRVKRKTLILPKLFYSFTILLTLWRKSRKAY